MIKFKIDENGYIENINTDNCDIEYIGFLPEDLTYFLDNCNFYKLENNTLVYDEQRKTAIENINALQTERFVLIQELQKTDYVTIKIAEGVSTKEEYGDILQQRQVARNRINEIDLELLNLPM